MLQLTVSNRLEALADALAERIERQPMADPLVAERIVVPHSGVGRWLQLRLAQRWGIAAQLRFELPAQLFGELLNAMPAEWNAADADSGAGGSPTLPVAGPDLAWQRPTLRWRVLRLLDALPAVPDLALLRDYLGAGGGARDRLRTWQLACRAADLFDAYQVYRPDWLAAWATGQRMLAEHADERWQAALWRLLVAQSRSPDRGRRWIALLDALGRAAPGTIALPTRLNLFGALPLSPLQMQLVSALAQRVDVALFHCAPSAAYWADLRSPRDAARRRDRRRRDGGRDAADEPALGPVEGLLASLGERARTMQQLQIEHWLDGSIEHERWIVPEHGDPLGWLQAAMLDLDTASAPPPPGPRSSITIHACASPRREVEVVLDRLLDAFHLDPTLRPHEVAIMAPSLDRYAPLIDAVIAATPAERRLPITLADHRADHLHPLIQRYLWLLRLPEVGFSRGELLGLLDCAEVRARFELGEDGLQWLRGWAADLGVARGLHAQQREDLGEGALGRYTWAAALDRLLLGQAAGDDGGVDDGIAAHATGDSTEAALAVGALWRLLRTLDRWRRRLADGAVTVGCDQLRQLFDAFFSVDGRDQAAADAESAIRDALAAIEQQIGTAQLAAAPGLEILAAALADALAQPSRWQRFLGEGITVCALVPLRSVPFRFIAVLGLDDGAFPRQVAPTGFDLIAAAPRVGDRQPREDDRQLLLDTLLAARERLHLSYVGIDPGDGSARPPAAPLAEIVDALRRAYASRWPEVERDILQRHPLTPFAVDNFRAATGSFASQWWPALQAERAGWREPRAFVDAPVPPADSAAAVDVTQLLRFYRHPPRAYLRDVLQLAPARWIEDADGDEPQSLDARSRRQLIERLWRMQSQGASLQSSIERIAAEGRLPAGLAGERALQQLGERFRAALDLLQGPSPTWLLLDLFDDGELLGLTGQMELAVEPRGPCAIGDGDPDARVWLPLAIGRELLHGRIDSANANCVYLDLNSRDDSPRIQSLQPLADAAAWIEALLAGWREGQAWPLPLPPRSAWAYAKAVAAGGSGASAMEMARTTWAGGGWERAESDDPDCAIAYRGRDPLAEAGFTFWTERLLLPLARAARSGGRK